MLLLSTAVLGVKHVPAIPAGDTRRTDIARRMDQSSEKPNGLLRPPKRHRQQQKTPLSVQRSCSVRFRFAKHRSGRKTLESDRYRRSEHRCLCLYKATVTAIFFQNPYTPATWYDALQLYCVSNVVAGTIPVERLEVLRRQSIRRGGACMSVTPHPFPRQAPWRRFRPAASLIQIPFRREFKTAAPV